MADIAVVMGRQEVAGLIPGGMSVGEGDILRAGQGAHEGRDVLRAEEFDELPQQRGRNLL
jgi:hypothetical protein